MEFYLVFNLVSSGNRNMVMQEMSKNIFKIVQNIVFHLTEKHVNIITSENH